MDLSFCCTNNFLYQQQQDHHHRLTHRGLIKLNQLRLKNLDSSSKYHIHHPNHDHSLGQDLLTIDREKQPPPLSSLLYNGRFLDGREESH
jgi:hypothetical protein